MVKNSMQGFPDLPAPTDYREQALLIRLCPEKFNVMFVVSHDAEQSYITAWLCSRSWKWGQPVYIRSVGAAEWRNSCLSDSWSLLQGLLQVSTTTVNDRNKEKRWRVDFESSFSWRFQCRGQIFWVSVWTYELMLIIFPEVIFASGSEAAGFTSLCCLFSASVCCPFKAFSASFLVTQVSYILLWNKTSNTCT